MTVACPRCAIYGRPGTSWHATGRFVTKVKGGTAFIAAEIACETAECRGRTWMSGLREAVDAGQRLRAERGDPAYVLNDPPESQPEGVQQPALPHSRVHQPSGLTGVGQLAQDFRRRQSGDDTP